MKTCNQCHIEINTSQTYCPLCHQTLIGSNDQDYVELYQNNNHNKTNYLYKIITIISLISVCSLIMINYSINTTLWSIIPILSIITANISYYILFLSKREFFDIVIQTSILLSIYIYILNYVIDDILWSIDIIIPSIFICSTALLSGLILFHKKYITDYLFHYFTIILLSIIITVITYLTLNSITL